MLSQNRRTSMTNYLLYIFVNIEYFETDKPIIRKEHIFFFTADLPALMQTSGAPATAFLWPSSYTHQRSPAQLYYISLSTIFFYAYRRATEIKYCRRVHCILS